MSTAATRKRILDAALDLFNEAGPEATSFRQIAREAELAYSNLVYHFPDKKRLAFALYQRLAAAWDAVPPPSPALADLRRWTEAMQDSLVRYPTFCMRHHEWLQYSAGVKIDFSQRRAGMIAQLTTVFQGLSDQAPAEVLAESWLFYLFQWPGWQQGAMQPASSLWDSLTERLLLPYGLVD